MSDSENRNISLHNRIGGKTPYVRSDEERVISIVAQMAEAIRTLARSATEGTAVSAFLTHSLGSGEHVENVHVGASACLPTIPDELVRADIDEDNLMPSSLPVRDLLVLEIEPFIVGVGWIKVDLTPKGLVVLKSEERKVENCHFMPFAVDALAARLNFLLEKYDPSGSLDWGELNDHQKEIYRATIRGITADFYDHFRRAPTIA